MVLPRLDSSPRVGDQAFEALHAAIMSGEFPSGRRLQIRELASDLGISVMPVREAIKRLEEQGLVESLPYRGAVVKRFDQEELLHIYGVRRVLEIEATTLGASHVGACGLDRMEDAYAAMVRALDAEDVAEYLDRDEEILQQIYMASGNPVLFETIQTLWDRCRPFKIIGVREEIESGHRARLLTHQRGLIEAVRKGDTSAAGRTTAASIDAATERVRGALDHR